jgi:hypothetical protein
MQVLKILLLLIIVFLPAAKATLKLDQKVFSTSLFTAPEVQNPALNSKVNLAFRDTNISTILLTLSKTADFNVVFPERYDRAITLTLKNQSVVDAVANICKLTNLDCEFKSNSLIVSADDLSDVLFESVPVLYRDAKDIALSLNEVLFSQLSTLAHPNAPKATATADPSKNSVIITANKEQIKAARNYIKKLDLAPQVKLFSANFLNHKDIKRLAKAFIATNSDLTIKRLEDKLFLLKGNENSVKSFYHLLMTKDHKPEPANFVMEVYGFVKDDPLLIDPNNQLVKANQALKLDQASFNGLAMMTVFEKIDSRNVQLNFAEQANIHGVTLTGSKNLLDSAQSTLTVFDSKFTNIADTELVVELLDKEGLDQYKELKQLLDQSPYLLVTLKPALAD